MIFNKEIGDSFKNIQYDFTSQLLKVIYSYKSRLLNAAAYKK